MRNGGWFKLRLFVENIRCSWLVVVLNIGPGFPMKVIEPWTYGPAYEFVAVADTSERCMVPIVMANLRH